MGNTRRDIISIGRDDSKNLIIEFSLFGNIKINQHKLKPNTKGHQEAYEAASDEV